MGKLIFKSGRQKTQAFYILLLSIWSFASFAELVSVDSTDQVGHDSYIPSDDQSSDSQDSETDLDQYLYSDYENDGGFFYGSPTHQGALDSVNNYNDFINDIDGQPLEDQISLHEVNAVSFAIVEGSVMTHYENHGFQDKAKTEPVTDQSLFNVASLSKFVAGLGIAEANRQGLLNLNRSMVDYAADYPGSILEEWLDKKFNNGSAQYPNSITVKRLMSHTAGLDTHSIGTDPDGFVPSMEKIILGDILSPNYNGVQPINEPGILFSYSGGGYTVAEHVLELTTDQSFSDFVTANVLVPAGMYESTFERADNSMPNLVHGCSQGLCLNPAPSTKVKAAGGLLATADEYAQLLIALINQGEDTVQGSEIVPNYNINRILKASSHKDSTFSACSINTDCPGRVVKEEQVFDELCFKDFGCIEDESPIVIPETIVSETCYLNQCQQLLKSTYDIDKDEDDQVEFYGMGVFLNGNIMSDGRHSLVMHSGLNADGFSTHFWVDREAKKGIVIFVAGDIGFEKNGDTYGANPLADEILKSFIEHYIKSYEWNK